MDLLQAELDAGWWVAVEDLFIVARFSFLLEICSHCKFKLINKYLLEI